MSELSTLKRLTLTARQLFDLEEILVGGFSPLTGFLKEKDYISVVEKMRLSDGSIWPIPIIFDQKKGHGLKVGEKIILCDTYGNPIAYFNIEDIYTPDKMREAKMVYGTTSTEHVGVNYLLNSTGDEYLGGKVELINLSPIYTFKELRHTPKQLKDKFKKAGYKKVIAFQTRNPIHRGHYELMKRSAEKYKAHLLIHPVVGITKDGDMDYISRVRAYKRLHETRMKKFSTLSLLPIAMRMAGPREALWHALIRKNYGATHFIIGRDHAGVRDNSGKSFYGIYDSQKLVKSFEKELGIVIVGVSEMVYIPQKNTHIPIDELKPGQKIKTISGTQFRKMLRDNEEIPEWFSFPEVVEELRIGVKKEEERGAVVFFTGLSGTGKSTIAHMLQDLLLERQNRSVTLLDGDVIRQKISKGLSFSHEDKNINLERIGFVANEIAKHGGIAICAVIAPYHESREKNRKLIESSGTYIEVFVDTPLKVCEKRDVKGLYEKARAGILQNFTGISDPYEKPKNPELRIDTVKTSPEKAAEMVYSFLVKRGVVKLNK